MKRWHGPFDHVDARARRAVFRRTVQEKAEEGTCECGICKSRRKRGDEPHGVPDKDNRLWVRLPHPKKEHEPPMARKVWLCSKPRVQM